MEHRASDNAWAATLEAATVRYLDEGTRALKQQLAAINKLRAATGAPALRIVEGRRAA